MKPDMNEGGIFLILNWTGVVKFVLCDPFGLVEESGSEISFREIADPGSREKAENFLKEIKNAGNAFLWELMIPVKEELKIFYFCGFRKEHIIFVFGFSDSGCVAALNKELDLSEEKHELETEPKRKAAEMSRSQMDKDISMYEELTRLNNELSRTQRELAKKKAEVERLSVTDPLTDVYNRRGFFRAAERDFERSVRFERPLAVLMLDIDHFKKINDHYGHPAGDKILSETAGILKRGVRAADLAGRYGGEEFVVLLVETEKEKGRKIAERLRQSIQKHDFKSDSHSIKVTVSIGMAPACEKCSDLEELVNRADQALYQAKENGRNRVEVF